MPQSNFQPPGNYKFGFNKPENYVFKAKKGLNKKTVEEISWHKKEPEWMRKFRLRSLESKTLITKSVSPKLKKNTSEEYQHSTNA